MKVLLKKNTIYGLKGTERDLDKSILDKFSPDTFEIIEKKEVKKSENKAILKTKTTKKI